MEGPVWLSDLILFLCFQFHWIELSRQGPDTQLELLCVCVVVTGVVGVVGAVERHPFN